MTTSTLLTPSNALVDETKPDASLHPSGPLVSRSHHAGDRNQPANLTYGLPRNPQSFSTAAEQRTAGRPSGPRDVRVSGLSTWTGRVVDIDDGLFTAELTPGPKTPGAKVLADFELDLVVTENEELCVGDVVYVTVRRVRAPHGLPNETSSVRLQRIGKWTAADVQEHSSRAQALFDEFSAYVED